MKVLRHLIAMIVLTSLLSACFVNNLIYKHIDWIIQYQIDRYFDLENPQEQIVETAVKENVAWFKRERMPTLLDLLDGELKDAQARRLDADSTDRWAKLFEHDRRLIIARLLPTMVQVGISLSSDQIAHFAKMMDRGNKNLKRAALAGASDFDGALDEFAESTFDRFEYLIGDLSDQQRTIIVNGMLWRQSDLQDELKVRQRSRDFWIEVLQKHDQATLELAIKRANNLDVVEPTESFVFYRKRSENWKAVRSALAPTMSEKQWLHLEKTLKELSEELHRLSGKGLDALQ
ncbi:MAG: hypothetical protein FJ146_04050 [Deltaproteobacteria bacterium]|nr:hypothetical protein [Deltaproteobacteria bacterium]